MSYSGGRIDKIVEEWERELELQTLEECGITPEEIILTTLFKMKLITDKDEHNAVYRKLIGT